MNYQLLAETIDRYVEGHRDSSCSMSEPVYELLRHTARIVEAFGRVDSVRSAPSNDMAQELQRRGYQVSFGGD